VDRYKGLFAQRQANCFFTAAQPAVFLSEAHQSK